MILNWLLSVASAFLLLLLFPRPLLPSFSLALLAPIALTPLLLACAREPRWKVRLLQGYVTGIIYWFFLCSWIQGTAAHYAGVSSLVAWLLLLLFSLAKALQLGAFAALAGRVLQERTDPRGVPPKWYAPPAVAALWVALEWTHPYTGFAWLHLGNAGSDLSLLLRLAPITGVWGLSFAFALMGSVIASVILRRRGASLWLVALAGLYLLPDVPEPSPGNAGAVLVQPNLDADTIWTTELLEDTESQLRLLSTSPATRASGSDIIVWPEMPIPFYVTDTAFRNFLTSVSATAHAPILTGAVARTDHGLPLNSALLTGLDGETLSRYDKVHLVPFGEFVPWPFAAITQKVSTEAGDFAAGSYPVVSKLGEHRIGTFICYESVFPSYVREFVAGGAEALFTLSNDAWFGTTPARYQHLRIVRMRAAEVRRWVVRATNNGVSAVIDPAGRVVKSLPEFRQAAARMPFAYRTDLTFYVRFGDWFVWCCGLLCAFAFGGSWIWTNPWGSSSSASRSSSSPSSIASSESSGDRIA